MIPLRRCRWVRYSQHEPDSKEPIPPRRKVVHSHRPNLLNSALEIFPLERRFLAYLARNKSCRSAESRAVQVLGGSKRKRAWLQFCCQDWWPWRAAEHKDLEARRHFQR